MAEIKIEPDILEACVELQNCRDFFRDLMADEQGETAQRAIALALRLAAVLQEEQPEAVVAIGALYSVLRLAFAEADAEKREEAINARRGYDAKTLSSKYHKRPDPRLFFKVRKAKASTAGK